VICRDFFARGRLIQTLHAFFIKQAFSPNFNGVSGYGSRLPPKAF